MTRLISFHLSVVLIISLNLLSCSGEDGLQNTSSPIKIPFESAFVLQEKLLLPEFVFGNFSHIERASNGDLLIGDESNQEVWLYLNESDSWTELVIDDCHPGIDTYIIGAAFSDDHIFLVNSPSLSGHSFMRDGSCGSRFTDSFPVPYFIKGLNDGFLGYLTRPGEEIPLLMRFDSNGNTIWETRFENHPNPAFSYRTMGGGIAVSQDGLAFVTTSSAPELHVLDIETGEFTDMKSPLFDGVFDGVNPGFNERMFRENMFKWMSEIGPHMIVAGMGSLSDDYILFSTPTMIPRENDDDYYLIYRLSDNAQFYTRIPEENNWTNMISQGYIHEIHHMDEHIELHIYGINEEAFPE